MTSNVNVFFKLLSEEMIMIFVFSLILRFSFILLIIRQPLRIGILILLRSFIIRVRIYYQNNPWFGFILFLIYIGGMLVIFAYITALIPNLAFKNFWAIKVFISLFCIWGSLLIKAELLGVPVWEEEFKSSFIRDYNNLGASLFSMFNINLVIGLALILLFVLIGVVKICYLNKGPLRPYK